MKQAWRFAGHALMLGAMVGPWLLPPLGSPSPSLPSWLFTLACSALLLGTIRENAHVRGALKVLGPGAVVWLVVATSGSQNTDVLAAGASVLMIIVCAVVSADMAAQQETVKTLAAAWMLAALLSCAIGLCQYLDIEGHFYFMSPAGPNEVFANLRQRNQFATLNGIGLLAMYWWVANRSGIEQQWSTAWLWPLAAALLAFCIVITGSRTGLVQLVMITALICWWHRSRQDPVRRLHVAVLVFYGLSALILLFIQGNANLDKNVLSRLQDGEVGCNSRWILWSNVSYLIGQRPWAGWGWGELDYAHFLAQYPGTRFCEILDNAHNLPLHLAVELGIPLAFSVCGGFAWLVLRARPWEETDATRRLAWGVIALILLHSMLEYPLWYGPFQMALGLCLGLLWFKPRPTTAVSGTDKRTDGVPWRWIVLSSILMAAAYAAWDYWRISQIYLQPEQRAGVYKENTLEKILDSRLFANQVRFAAYSVASITRENAGETYEEGLKLLHFSPEPRVVEKLIESAMLLKNDKEAHFYLSRYKAAYPQDHARWMAQQ